jgi:hypothetical protein
MRYNLTLNDPIFLFLAIHVDLLKKWDDAPAAFPAYQMNRKAKLFVTCVSWLLIAVGAQSHAEIV